MKIERELYKNKAYLQERFHRNQDIKFRDFSVGCRDGCVIFVDGMTNKAEINEFVLMVMQRERPRERCGRTSSPAGGCGKNSEAKAQSANPFEVGSRKRSEGRQRIGREGTPERASAESPSVENPSGGNPEPGISAAESLSVGNSEPGISAAEDPSVRERDVGQESMEQLLERVVATAEAELCTDADKLVQAVLDGDCVLLMDGEEQALIAGVKQWDTRGIVEPPTSAVLKGPREGFNEDLKTNTILLRRRIRSDRLVFESYQAGRYSNTKVMVAYLDDIVDKKVLREVVDKIKAIDIDGIIDSSYLAKYLDIRSYSIFQQVGTSEKPDIVAAKLLEGRIAVFVDGSPIVLTVPYLLLEAFQSPEDYYERRFRATFVRILRYIGLFLAVLVPAFYVSAQVFNLGLIPLRFTITILNSIKGIPLSPASEMFFVVLIFEILNEASIRMPKYVGMALSIVGALVLGETAVSAGIVSTPTLMIMALSAISLYTVPELQGTLSLLRIVFLFIAGMIGIFGIILGGIFLMNYLFGLEAYGTPYTAPYAPLIRDDLKDSILKDELLDMRTRPESIRHRNRIRLKRGEEKQPKTRNR